MPSASQRSQPVSARWRSVSWTKKGLPAVAPCSRAAKRPGSLHRQAPHEVEHVVLGQWRNSDATATPSRPDAPPARRTTGRLRLRARWRAGAAVVAFGTVFGQPLGDVAEEGGARRVCKMQVVDQESGEIVGAEDRDSAPHGLEKAQALGVVSHRRGRRSDLRQQPARARCGSSPHPAGRWPRRAREGCGLPSVGHAFVACTAGDHEVRRPRGDEIGRQARLADPAGPTIAIIAPGKQAASTCATSALRPTNGSRSGSGAARRSSARVAPATSVSGRLSGSRRPASRNSSASALVSSSGSMPSSSSSCRRQRSNWARARSRSPSPASRRMARRAAALQRIVGQRGLHRLQRAAQIPGHLERIGSALQRLFAGASEPQPLRLDPVCKPGLGAGRQVAGERPAPEHERRRGSARGNVVEEDVDVDTHAAQSERDRRRQRSRRQAGHAQPRQPRRRSRWALLAPSPGHMRPAAVPARRRVRPPASPAAPSPWAAEAVAPGGGGGSRSARATRSRT